jgi:hypothetical protein
MPRRSWDEPTDDGLDDEPVALTARQLRSLKRGASFGFIALILALIAAGAAGYTTFRVMTQAPVTTAAAPAAAEPQATGGMADTSTVTAGAPATAPTEAAAPTATEAAAPNPTVHKISAAPKAARAAKTEVAVVKSSKRTRASTTARTSKPVTESFDPGPAAPAGVAPSPVPMPVSAEPTAKPAGHDSSGAH